MTLGAIIGHGPLVDLLRHAVARGRVPQSLILAGPEGVGKHAVAVALAQAVNCPKQANGDGCGLCSTCTRIARGQHSDVAIVQKGDEASIKIQTLRERVLDQVGYRPFEARYRVFIIDPADEITDQGQDALLKTLEEPPRSAILILVTAYPDQLRSTIRSRCRRLRFGVLPETDVARVLVERVHLERALATRLSAASGGSVTRALADQAGDFDDDRDASLALLVSARQPSIPARLKAAANFAQHGSKRRDREAFSTRLALLATLVRDLGALKAGGSVPLANNDLADRLAELSASFDIARLASAASALDRAEQALGRNASPKIVADWLAVNL